MMSLCHNCGFKNPEGMRFCGNCGSRLAGAIVAPEPVSHKSRKDGDQPGVLIGADLAERMKRAGLEAAGQRRDVTVLFVDISGFTALSERLDAEDVYEIVQEYIQALSRCVYNYEGMIDKLTGDGLMALFGAPIAHENNAERAVRAAIEMQAEVQRLSLEFQKKLRVELSARIGLHSGLVIVGGIGSDLLMDYTAVGDTVNLAHRLEEAAPKGAILVSESVYRQTRAFFDYETRPNLALKGISRPIDAYVFRGLKEKPAQARGVEGLSAPMVGREVELASLRTRLANMLENQQGQFVLITGEAGLGKSRLTREFKASLGRQDVQILEGQGLAYRRMLPYGVFRTILLHWLDLPAHASQDEISKRLAGSISRLFNQSDREILLYLENLLSLPYTDAYAADRLQYLEAEQLRQRVFWAVGQLLKNLASERPLILILDDLHWADEASLELISHLVHLLLDIPLFLVAVSRTVLPGSMSNAVEWASQFIPQNHLTIQLRSLSMEQSGLLLQELLEIPSFPSELRLQILERAAGIPFYLEEILRMLIDQGLLRRGGSGWELADEVQFTLEKVPDTLQGLILARFDCLESLQRKLLQAAAVMGKDFILPIVSRIIQPISDEELLQALAGLIEREYVFPRDVSSQEFSFRHVLMSDAIYSTLLRRERKRLHGEVGRAIEALFPNRIDEYVDLLARHYSMSAALDRALHYLILAGQKSARGYLTGQARQNFETALGLLEKVDHSVDQAVSVYVGLGELLVLNGEYIEARRQFELAQEVLSKNTSAFDGRQQCKLERMIAITYERQGEYDQALEHLSLAPKRLGEEISAPIEIAAVLNDMGWIQFRRGNLDAALEQFQGALGLLEDTTQYDLIASIYNRLGGVFYQKDQLDQASNYVRKSLVLRQEIGDVGAVARSYNNLGLLAWKRGNWDDALENFERSLELQANLGDVEGLVELQSNLGLLQLDRGYVAEAVLHFQQALGKAEQIGHQYNVGMCLLYLSRLYASTEEWEKALDYANRSAKALEEIKALEDLVNVYTYQGRCWHNLGDSVRAVRCVDEALALLKKLQSGDRANESRGWALRLLGEIELSKGNFEQAEAWLRESMQIFVRLGSQVEQARTMLVKARLSAAQKQFLAARMLCNEAKMIFGQLGARLDREKTEEFLKEIGSDPLRRG